MPLSALRLISLEDKYWQGWRDYLHNTPLLSQQEGEVAHLLNQLTPAHFPKRFVPQASLPSHLAYESFIYENHCIPTRDGLHDFFNGLCWLSFPLTKLSFNRIHQHHIQSLGTTQRGKVRDMLTVIDENGFLIACPDALWDALQAKEWVKAFVDLRELWQQTKVMVFGHALLEKLVYPYKAITAHAVRIPSSLCEDTVSTLAPAVFSPAEINKIDTYLSHYLDEECLASKPYIPIQIFGIPDWSKEIQDLNFYQDTKVFRLPRSKL